jgi:hypothetical protein
MRGIENVLSYYFMGGLCLLQGRREGKSNGGRQDSDVRSRMEGKAATACWEKRLCMVICIAVIEGGRSSSSYDLIA